MPHKKCIVLDLDNTLWGGIVGEDGPEGIALSHKGAGANFIAFQQALLDMHDRGIILAINSNNNPDDAWEVIRKNPNMILKEKHFAAHRVNWNDKATNLRELAKELNIGLDSMVFFDDSPTNRHAVRGLLPEVEVPELPEDPALYTKTLLSLPYFATKAITDEDKMRGNLYVTERLRKEAEKNFTSQEEFLKSLDLEVQVFRNNPESADRLAQLTEKTNQFNTNKHPLTPEEVRALVDSSGDEVFHARVTDRFGDHGITAVAFISKPDGRWHIDTLLMSCRVLGRGIEEAFMHAIGSAAENEGAETITLTFVETEKNAPARTFVERVFAGGALSPSATELPPWITLRIL
jgi:FkbH-like protein